MFMQFAMGELAGVVETAIRVAKVVPKLGGPGLRVTVFGSATPKHNCEYRTEKQINSPDKPAINSKRHSG
jgi:hypothetical protein